MSSTEILALPPMELKFGAPFQPFTTDYPSQSHFEPRSSSISMHSFGSQPSLRSSLRSSIRSSENSSVRSFKTVRFGENPEKHIITTENDAPCDSLSKTHLPIDGTVLRNGKPSTSPRRFRAVSNRRPQAKQSVVETSPADFEEWLSKMDTLQKRDAPSPRKQTRAISTEKEKKSKRSWLDLLSKV